MNIDLLQRLCETPGIPGREHAVRDLIMAECDGLFDSMEVDPMGNLLCHRKAAKPDAPKVMMACHMDEIGFLVSHITDAGMLYVQPKGGFDPRNLFSRRVLVCTENGTYKGAMNPGGRPIHISSPEERKKIPEVTDFFVDLGLGAATKDKVKIGDFVVMDEPFVDLGEKVMSKAIDNRFACWLGIESIRALDDADRGADIYVAFTVQEEIGLRGAQTIAHKVQPDIGIGVDVTLSCDTPGIPEQFRTTTQGDGVGLHIADRSIVSDIDLIRDFEALAQKHGIPHQRTMLANGGQDGAALQQSGDGARALGIVVGTRYIHTVTEMMDKSDLIAAQDLLVAYFKSF